MYSCYWKTENRLKISEHVFPEKITEKWKTREITASKHTIAIRSRRPILLHLHQKYRQCFQNQIS